MVQPLWRIVWIFLNKPGIKLPYDPTISLLDMYLKDSCTPIFNATLFTIVKRRKQPKCPSTEEWLKKM